jgi:hypothetical protein
VIGIAPTPISYERAQIAWHAWAHAAKLHAYRNPDAAAAWEVAEDALRECRNEIDADRCRQQRLVAESWSSPTPTGGTDRKDET